MIFYDVFYVFFRVNVQSSLFSDVMNLDEIKARTNDLVTYATMGNIKPKESEEQTEDEKPASTKPQNDIKPAEAKGDEEYFDEVDRPPSPKLPNDIKHLYSQETKTTVTNATNQIAYTSQTEEHFDIKIAVNTKEVRFDSSPNVDPPYSYVLNQHKRDEVIPNDYAKHNHADSDVKSNNAMKEDEEELNFPRIKDPFEIEFEKDSIYDKVVTQMDALGESWEKEFVDSAPGLAGVVPVTPEVEAVAVDGPFSTIFPKTKHTIKQYKPTEVDGIRSTHVVFFPKEREKRTEKFFVDSDQFYDMRTFPRGKLTIINVKYFRSSSGMSDYPREGTDRDAAGLQELFLDLGFIVERYDNPTKSKIREALRDAANEDYSNLSCCACALLSHGEERVIYGTDGFMNIKDLTSLFRTKGLAGKPKLFFFQAYQGSEYMDPYDSVDGPGSGKKDIALPVESDFLFCYSTVKGYYSWRNSKRGSWFMEALVQVFRNYAHKMDIMRMLMRVNSTVAHRKSRTDAAATDDKRQIESFITQMRKEFFFFPPYGPLPLENSS